MAGRQRYSVTTIKAALIQHKGLCYLTARALGCTHQTLRNYLQRYPTLRECMEEQRGVLVDTAEEKLWESIVAGEAWGISLCLRTLGRGRGYVERSEVHEEHEAGAGLMGLLAERRQARIETLLAKRNGHGGHDTPEP